MAKKVTPGELAKLRQALLDARGTDGDEWQAWQRAATAYHLALVPEDELWRADPEQPALRSREEIRDRAAKLEEANRAIHETVAHRDTREGYLAWTTAAGWAHEMAAAMYPPLFWRALEAVRASDRSGLEPIIRFLEADPWCFRSGYVKENLIPPLIRMDLEEGDKARLRAVVLNFVDCPKPRRELRSYIHLARAVANAELEEALMARLLKANPVARFNAQAILDGLAGNQPARTNRKASPRSRRSS
jgi:hypothetical protein